MAVKIMERESFRIIGTKVDTLLKDTREQMIIPQHQQSFHERLKEVDGAIGLPITYGVFIDPPNYNPDTDPFSWIAGVEVHHDAEPPEGMISYELPKATYAVLDYKGDIDRAGNVYGQLYDWIIHSEYVQAGSYGFEMYSKVYSMSERQNAEFLLYFPVRKK